jgi:predicted nucleic acid-binding protein
LRFWDSSALVPILVVQAVSPRILALYKKDPEVVVWWAARVECESAVVRLERQDMLPPKEAAIARRRLDVLARSWQEVPALDGLRDHACRLLRVHTLRAADSLQLAAALIAAEQRPAALHFVCLDERLAFAADREGFPVIR